MAKSVNVSEEGYEWLLKKASKRSITENKNISIADIVDELIKGGD